MTTDEMNIHQRMARIVAGLPGVPKDSVNKNLGFKFRSIDDITEALKPLLAEYQVYVVPVVLDMETETWDREKGVMRRVVVQVRYTFYGPAGDFVEAVVWGEGMDTGDKAVSKAFTLAFKTCLSQVFAITSEDDPDAEAPQAEPRKAKLPLKGGTVASAPRVPTVPAAPLEAATEAVGHAQDVRAECKRLLGLRFLGDVDVTRKFMDDKYGPNYQGFNTLTDEQIARLYEELTFIG